jgi:hypothetical protein
MEPGPLHKHLSYGKAPDPSLRDVPFPSPFRNPLISTLKMESICTSEMLANVYQSIRYQNPEYLLVCLLVYKPFVGDTFNGNLKMYRGTVCAGPVRATCSAQQLEDTAVEVEAPSYALSVRIN